MGDGLAALMIKCPTCNFINKEGALFCEECGAYFHSGGSLATDALKDPPPSQTRLSSVTTSAPGSSPQEARLILTSEADERQFTILSRDRTALIGRNDRRAKVFVDIDPTGEGGQTHAISRRHARVHFLNGNFLIEDVESLNGTYLNGRKLRPYLPEVLHKGDVIRLGDLALKVSLES